MNRIFVISLLLSLTMSWANAQVSLQNEEQIMQYKGIPQERIFMHVNTSMFLTGEYLYYKVYCLNNETSYFSNLSKIAYVTLISDKGEQLFKQKIKLENGLGNGDFFIPVSAQTGSYKLLAYTNWMTNSDVSLFFQKDIHIINPYQVKKTSKQASSIAAIDTIVQPKKVKNTTNITNKSNGPLTLVLNDRVFKTRSKVIMTMRGKNATNLPYGNYSLSVRKRDQLPQASKQAIVTYIQNLEQMNIENNDPQKGSISLPELRGELISGKVSTTTNNSIKNLKIAASIPGKNYFIAIAKTDDQGNFYLNVDSNYEGDRLFFEILNKPYQDYKIVIKQKPSLDYSKLKFKNLLLDPAMTNGILQRSIHNQIENAYFKYKPDSTLTKSSKQLFDGKEVQTYKLDDFTRFKTVRETIFEIVKDVSITRMNKSNAALRVQGYNYGTNSGVLPLIIIDGLQVTNHTHILDYSASNIDEIMVYRDRFILGTKLFQGAILLKTKNNTIETFQNNASLFSFNVSRPQLNKNYFTQRYDTIATSRIPDDRMQLAWIPHLKVTEKQSTFDFFTSDVTGDFEIYVEGFTAEQEPVSIRGYFSVRN